MANPYAVLKPVESSMFTRAGYDEDTWQLIFEFKSTKEIKAYLNVAPEVAEEALSAKSLGTWWNQNVRGNHHGWEFEILGADPSVAETAPKPVAAPAPDLGITEEDIQSVDPTYNAEPGINGLPAYIGDEDHPLTTYPTYGGIDRSQTIIHMTEVADWPQSDAGNVTMEMLQQGFGKTVRPNQVQPGKIEWGEGMNIASTSPFTEEDVFTGEVTVTAPNLANISKPEIMPEWETPENAYQALELLSERETEIDAIIEQNKRVGADALLVKVGDADSRVKAATLLTNLVENKDRTIELLDPFRKVLYESYEYAAGKKKAALDPIEGAIKQVKLRCTTWDDEQRRMKQEADRKAREAADAEARRRQEAERERLTLLEVNDKLEQGDEQGAQLVFDAPIQAPKPYVEPIYQSPVTPTIEGHSSSQKWKVDEAAIESEQDYAASIMALLRAVRNDQIEMRMAASYLKWDIVSLNKLAGALRNAFSVPGLSAKPVTNLRVARNK